MKGGAPAFAQRRCRRGATCMADCQRLGLLPHTCASTPGSLVAVAHRWPSAAVEEAAYGVVLCRVHSDCRGADPAAAAAAAVTAPAAERSDTRYLAASLLAAACTTCSIARTIVHSLFLCPPFLPSIRSHLPLFCRIIPVIVNKSSSSLKSCIRDFAAHTCTLRAHLNGDWWGSERKGQRSGTTRSFGRAHYNWWRRR
jgi:hypothetical protein